MLLMSMESTSIKTRRPIDVITITTNGLLKPDADEVLKPLKKM